MNTKKHALLNLKILSVSDVIIFPIFKATEELRRENATAQ